MELVPDAEKHWLGASLYRPQVPFTGALPAGVRGPTGGGVGGAVSLTDVGTPAGYTPVKRIEGSVILSIIPRTDPSSGGRMSRR